MALATKHEPKGPPTLADEAWWLGHQLGRTGRTGVRPDPRAGYSVHDAVMFFDGLLTAILESEA